MKTYFSVAAVATTLLLGQLALAQGAPPVEAFSQQGAYAQSLAPSTANTQDILLTAYQEMGARCGDYGCDDCGGADCDQCCGEGCGVGCGDACCDMDGCIKWEVYADYLYLRARNAEVAFAVNTNAVVQPPAAPVQVGPVTVVDPDAEAGFRIGVRNYFEPCASLGAEYWHFESSTSAFATTDVTTVIQSLVTHPGTASAARTWQEAGAVLDVDFERVNIDFRAIISCSDRHEIALVGGLAYGNLDQDFAAGYSVLGTTAVITDVSFDGAGIRLGVEAERHARCSGLFVYGKGYASFLAGEFSSSYFQTQSFDPVVVNTSWKAGRVVPVLDIELGAGWSSCNGGLRLSAGYLVSGWYNTVRTDKWIKAVQNNNFTGLSDTMSFDGLVVRGEVRF